MYKTVMIVLCILLHFYENAAKFQGGTERILMLDWNQAQANNYSRNLPLRTSFEYEVF